MRKLEDVRVTIDQVDEELVRLFEKRMKLAEDVVEIKTAENLPIFDGARENKVVERAVNRLENSGNAGAIRSFYHLLMTMSKARQREIMYSQDEDWLTRLIESAKPLKQGQVSVIYQGVSGAYSYEATLQTFGGRAKLENVETFENVFQKIQKGEADYGVLPIENSIMGGVAEVQDHLRSYGCFIVGETEVAVHHCLAAIPGTRMEDVREVRSHPQALGQCREYLQAHHMQGITWINTAVAGESVAEEKRKDLAALCSSTAAKLHGLEILEENVEDKKNNRTRFIIVAAQMAFQEDFDKTSILFSTEHRSGALLEALSAFAVEDLNLLRIESRPTGHKGWDYWFFVDFAGNVKHPAVQKAMRQLAAEASYFEVLGCYKAAGK